MNFQLTEKPAFTIMGKRMTVRHGEEETQTIPAYWGRSTQEDWYRRLCGMCRTDMGVMGVCVSTASDVKFDYYIAVEKTAEMDAEGFETCEIPASAWARFESVGPMPKAIQDVWKYVMTEWLPSSGYRHAGTPDLEVYTLGDMDQADYRSYVWIPVVKA